MHFEELIKKFDKNIFPKLGEKIHPDKESVVRIKDFVGLAVIDDDFICDCILHEIKRISSGNLNSGLVPFFIVPDLGIRLSFGYWSPLSGVAAHEHTAWTVTSVCSNYLEVTTFDRSESYRRKELVPKNRFTGIPGMSGYIYDPCIHEPRNPSTEWSVTFHVSSPLDGERPSDQIEQLECLMEDNFLMDYYNHPYLDVLKEQQKVKFITQLVLLLNKSKSNSKNKVLRECFNIAPNKIRRIFDVSKKEPGKDNCQINIVNENLQMLIKDEKGNNISVLVNTPKGQIRQMIINNIAKPTLEKIVNEKNVSFSKLPKILSTSENLAIVEALEDLGLIKITNNKFLQ